MNILIFNSHNPFKASGIVGLDLFNALKKGGSTVKLIVNRHSTNYPEGIISMETRYRYWKKWAAVRLKRLLRLKRIVITDSKYHFNVSEEKKEFFSAKQLLKKARLKPDAIIILFTKDFINAKNIYELYEITHAPVYWLMYDMSPLTGGCHYAWNCRGYQNNCGKCPALFSSDPADITFKNLLYKKTYIDKTNITIVPGGEWLNRQTHESSLFKNRDIYKIFPAIDNHIFKHIDKAIIRKRNRIPGDRKVIFFGAVGFLEERKGMKYLLEAIKILKEISIVDSMLSDKIYLLVAGNGFDEVKDDLPFEKLDMGMLDNAYGIASAYQSADVFVCPSIEDSGPMMINQSIMCGTPVVSFEMGVAFDLVINGETGFRVKLRDSRALAHAIFSVLKMNDHESFLMSENCRKLALELCHPDVISEKWLKKIQTDI
jgi:glycosyltransferase involved in cell wall biosynthesis